MIYNWLNLWMWNCRCQGNTDMEWVSIGGVVYTKGWLYVTCRMLTVHKRLLCIQKADCKLHAECWLLHAECGGSESLKPVLFNGQL